MIVDDVMTKDVISVPPDMPLKEVAKLLTEHGISGVPVVDGGRVVGVVSETDIVAKESGDRKFGFLGRRSNGRVVQARTAGEAMTSPAVTVQGRAAIAAAATLMIEHEVNRLPVVDDRGFVGIVTRADLVHAFSRPDEDIRADVVHTLRNLWVSPENVEVGVDGGEVVLRGTVTIPKIVKSVPAAIAAVPGVVSVRSELIEG